MTARLHWSSQFWRYAVVGLASNGLLFGLYVALTAAGMRPIVAMSLGYVVGVLQTFVVNRRWSFASREAAPRAFARYVVAYILGYVFNLATLSLLHHHAGLPHEWVQAVSIVLTAVLLFLLQRHWVFRGESIAGATSAQEP